MIDTKANNDRGPEKTGGGLSKPSNVSRATSAFRQVPEKAFQGLTLAVFLVGIIAYFGSRSSLFFTSANAITIFASAAVIGIVSLGQIFTIISGGFDLSVSGVVPLGSVVFALSLNAGHGLFVAFLLVVGLGALVGIVNGLVVVKLQISPLIATLGTMSIAAGVALTLSKGVSVPFNDPSQGILAETSIGSIPNHIWIFAGLSIVGLVVLRYTHYGRAVYAVGGSKEASRLAGIRVDAMTVSVYAISGTLASLAGAVLASELLTGVGTAGSDSALTSIAAVVLGGAALTGGIGGIGGTVVGVIILSTLANGMSVIQVPSFYQQIATGLVLLVAVSFSKVREIVRR